MIWTPTPYLAKQRTKPIKHQNQIQKSKSIISTLRASFELFKTTITTLDLLFNCIKEDKKCLDLKCTNLIHFDLKWQWRSSWGTSSSYPQMHHPNSSLKYHIDNTLPLLPYNSNTLNLKHIIRPRLVQPYSN